jgi:hypothetical protein
MRKTTSVPQTLSKHIKTLGLVIVLAGILASSIIQTTSAGIYSIRILPGVTQATTGTTFDVILQANMVVDAKATGLIKGSLTYPSNLVTLQNVTPGQYPELTISTSDGLVTVSSPDKGSGNGYGGQQKILTATFKVIAGGTATFSANNGTTSGVMIVNGTNHVVVDGTVTTIGCQPAYTGIYPNCVAPVQPTTPSTNTSTTPTSPQASTKQQSVTATNPTSVPAPATTTPAPAATETALTQTTLTNYGQIDAELERCLSTTLGRAVYEDLVQHQSRLSYEQVNKTRQCFTQRSSVVPDELAPVAPTLVKNLPTTSSVTLEKLNQITARSNPAIRLSGKAHANQTVLIYLFSEPVVLVAKTDADGNWGYTLQDPMEPGKHEAYVTVEGSNTKAVRSESFGFAIAAAPKTTQNPLGLSLKLQQADRSQLFYSIYVAGVIGVVAIALFISVRILRHSTQNHHTTSTTSSSDDDPGAKPIVGSGS